MKVISPTEYVFLKFEWHYDNAGGGGCGVVEGVFRFAALVAVLQFVGLDGAADLVTVKSERMVKDVLA